MAINKDGSVLDSEQCLVLHQVFDGMTSAQISAETGIGQSRVNAIIRRTCNQLQVSSRHDAAQQIALHFGWHSRPDVTEMPADNRLKFRNGAKYGLQASTSAQTKREHREFPAHIKVVEDNHIHHDPILDMPEQLMGGITKLIPNNAQNKFSKILLAVLTIMVSVLTVSMLIVTLQGFSKLISSR